MNNENEESGEHGPTGTNEVSEGGSGKFEDEEASDWEERIKEGDRAEKNYEDGVGPEPINRIADWSSLDKMMPDLDRQMKSILENIAPLNRTLEQNNQIQSFLNNLYPSFQDLAGVKGLSASVRDLYSRQISPIKDMNLPVPQSSLDAIDSVNRQVQQSLGVSESMQSATESIKGLLAKTLRQYDIPQFATDTQRWLSTTDDLRFKGTQTVWHYSNGYVLKQVISSRYLWASSSSNLNDASEVHHGVKIIRAAFQRGLDRLGESKLPAATMTPIRRLVDDVLSEEYINSIVGEVHIISATTQKDSLTLWRNYAKGDGFALGLNPRQLLSPDGLMLDEENAREGVPRISGWFKVLYAANRKFHAAKSLVDNALKDIQKTSKGDWGRLTSELRKHILILASTMKHEAFRDEREVRYITTTWTVPDEILHYEHVRNTIVPVLHLAVPTKETELELLPLRGVRCSPLTAPSITTTIGGMLAQHGYSDAARRVERSDIPFTG